MRPVLNHCPDGNRPRPSLAGAAAALVLACGAASAAFAQTPPSPAGLDFFEKSVRPVFVSHCFGCHSANATKVRGGLRMDSLAALLAGGDSGPAIVPGNSAPRNAASVNIGPGTACAAP